MKRFIINWVLFFLSLAIAAFCAYEIFAFYGNEPLNALYVVVMVLSFPVLSLLHELGHMLFGALVKIKAVPDLNKKVVFGSASCTVVPKTDKGLNGRIIFTASGGLFVNLLFIALGVVALFVPAVPVAISICVLPASFYLFALNVAPIQLDGGKTDGLVIYELIKNSDSAKVTLAVLTVQAQVLNGKKIEETDENLLFGLPGIQEDDPAFISLTELRYEYCKAKGDTEQAEKYKERLEQLKEYLN